MHDGANKDREEPRNPGYDRRPGDLCETQPEDQTNHNDANGNDGQPVKHLARCADDRLGMSHRQPDIAVAAVTPAV